MAARRPGSTRSAGEPSELRIARLGAEGDGIGEFADGTAAYVPLTLPGELVRARPVIRRGDGWAAVLQAVIEPSPDRVEPLCQHFGTCGGCVAQHVGDPTYSEWKSAEIAAALRRAGFDDIPLGSLARTPPRARRRMDLALRRTGRGVIVGLHRARSAEVVDLAGCDVLDPVLTALIAPLRTLLAPLSALRRTGSAIVNKLDSGLDLLLRTDAPLALSDRLSLTAFARSHAVARVSWAARDDTAEPVCVLRSPTVALSGVAVAPPPGAFLQASVAGEAAVVAAVLAGLPKPMPAHARIAELYAGCGTLTFALARHGRVCAWEGEAAALAALAAAAGRAGAAVEARQRDLARQPLRAAELARFAIVVLDPPHAGAPVQVAEIAAARVARVIYVSCNPAALGRDARTLAAAGYRLAAVTPIDQFLWSARVESVAVFGLG